MMSTVEPETLQQTAPSDIEMVSVLSKLYRRVKHDAVFCRHCSTLLEDAHRK
jgi:hypothetical protein